MRRNIIIGKQYPVNSPNPDIYVNFSNITDSIIGGVVLVHMQSRQPLKYRGEHSDYSTCDIGYYKEIRHLKGFLKWLLELNSVEIQMDLSGLDERKKAGLHLCDILSS